MTVLQMKKSRFTDSQIMGALRRVEAGLSVADICRELGISTATLFKWRVKYAGMDTSMMARMKELEVTERSAREDVCRGAAQGGDSQRGPQKKEVRPFRRREMPKRMVTERGIPIRLACVIFLVGQTCYRYEAKKDAENEQIANWLLRLTGSSVPLRRSLVTMVLKTSVVSYRTGAEEAGTAFQYIQPGKPQRNAYVERVSRTVRYDWLS